MPLWQSLPGSVSGNLPHKPAITLRWSVVLFVLLAGVMVSGSRTGTATAMLVTLLAVVVVLLPSSEKFKLAHACGALALLLGVFATVGLNAFFSRLDSRTLGADALLRWQEISSSWQAAMAFWPVGSGPGSFAGVYTRFQPPGLRGVLDHAHNDYVELVVELGALSVALVGLIAWLAVRQSILLWNTSRSYVPSGKRYRRLQLQVCCALGVLAVALHSWLDFNLHIPANAMLCAFLLGSFLRR